MGFYEDTGILILGTRLKRLSERFLSEVGKIYDNLDLDFEAAWFPIVFLIHKKRQLSITAISEELNFSQPAASQLVSLLSKKGIFQMIPDKNDKRRKIVSLTPRGEHVISQLLPIWKTLEEILLEIFEEEEIHIVESFNQLECKLNKINIGDSVLNKLKIYQEGIL